MTGFVLFLSKGWVDEIGNNCAPLPLRFAFSFKKGTSYDACVIYQQWLLSRPELRGLEVPFPDAQKAEFKALWILDLITVVFGNALTWSAVFFFYLPVNTAIDYVKIWGSDFSQKL